MKRSELIKSIEYILFQTEKFNNLDRAKKIADLIENLGMKPPKAKFYSEFSVNERGIISNKPCFVVRRKWEL